MQEILYVFSISTIALRHLAETGGLGQSPSSERQCLPGDGANLRVRFNTDANSIQSERMPPLIDERLRGQGQKLLLQRKKSIERINQNTFMAASMEETRASTSRTADLTSTVVTSRLFSKEKSVNASTEMPNPAPNQDVNTAIAGVGDAEDHLTSSDSNDAKEKNAALLAKCDADIRATNLLLESVRQPFVILSDFVQEQGLVDLSHDNEPDKESEMIIDEEELKKPAEVPTEFENDSHIEINESGQIPEPVEKTISQFETQLAKETAARNQSTTSGDLTSITISDAEGDSDSTNELIFPDRDDDSENTAPATVFPDDPEATYDSALSTAKMPEEKSAATPPLSQKDTNQPEKEPAPKHRKTKSYA